MTTTTADKATAPVIAHCLRCGRALRRPTTDGYGPKCRTRIRKAAAAAKAAILAPFKPAQAAKAVELIEQGGVIPLRGRRVFLSMSSDGLTAYRTAVTGQCNCPAGLKAVRCYHVAAARIVALAA